MLGRFGWKAARRRSATRRPARSPATWACRRELLPGAAGDCTQAQAHCRGAPGGGPAARRRGRDTVFDLVTFYARNLAVPARGDVDAPDVLRGKQVFYQSGCAACHAPKYVTRVDPERPELSASSSGPTRTFCFTTWAGTGRRPIGRPRHRPGVADAAALGHWLHGTRQRPQAVPPRRPRAEPAGGGPLARRRGRGREAERGADDARRTRGIAGIPGLAMIG